MNVVIAKMIFLVALFCVTIDGGFDGKEMFLRVDNCLRIILPGIALTLV
jgi:hypothetical protein